MLSSILCRAQAAIHLDRAANTSLANVRTIAERAASAWASEALSADKREQREQARIVRAAAQRSDDVAQQRHDRSLSENPDRGFATA